MDKKILEQKELESLNERGKVITISGKNFRFREPFLQTLDYLSEIALKMEFNEQQFLDEPTKAANQLKKLNNKLFARWVACFYLERRILIILLGWFYTWYFFKIIRTSDMIGITMDLRMLENDPSFINSIRLIAQMPRTSEPKAELVEKKG